DDMREATRRTGGTRGRSSRASALHPPPRGATSSGPERRQLEIVSSEWAERPMGFISLRQESLLDRQTNDAHQLLHRQHGVAVLQEDHHRRRPQLSPGLTAQTADAQSGQALAAARPVDLGGIERQDRQRGAALRRRRVPTPALLL